MDDTHKCSDCDNFMNLGESKRGFGSDGGVLFYCPVVNDFLVSNMNFFCTEFTPLHNDTA